MRLLGAIGLLCLAVGWAPAAEESPALDSGTHPGWLGVWLGDAVDGGVQVVAVAPWGPAARGGVQTGDILLQANERPLGGRRELEAVLERSAAGERIRFVVLRAGSKRPLEVVLGERDSRDWGIRGGGEPPSPAQPPDWPPSASWSYTLPSFSGRWQTGLRVADVTPMLRAHYGAPEDAGVLVVSATEGRLAQRAGIEVGDVVVLLAGQKVRTSREFREILGQWKTDESLEVQLVRDGKVRRVELRPEAAAAPPGSMAATLRAYQEKRLRAELERLERRIEELRQQLKQLSSEP